MSGDDDARLQRWWGQLSAEQRAAALRSVRTGILPEGLTASLRREGHPGTKAGSTKMSADVVRFLKLRHDT